MSKLVRLTEADLHRIIKESINRVLMESVDNLEMLKMKVKKAKKGSPEWLKAVQEYQKAKEMAGKVNMVVNPSSEEIRQAKIAAGTDPDMKMAQRWKKTKGLFKLKNELDKEDNERAKEMRMRNRAEFGEI